MALLPGVSQEAVTEHERCCGKRFLKREALREVVQEDVTVVQQWRVSGLHYHRTLEDWLTRQDAAHSSVLSLFVVGLLLLFPLLLSSPFLLFTVLSLSFAFCAFRLLCISFVVQFAFCAFRSPSPVPSLLVCVCMRARERVHSCCSFRVGGEPQGDRACT